MKIKNQLTDSNLPNLVCACASLRRASRIVTRLYAEELSETGLQLPQFTLLMALNRTGELSQAQLSKVLALDQTTLTRSLAPLIERGWVKSGPGRDKREKLFRLTTTGKLKFESALPAWQKAQGRLQNVLTANDWGVLTKFLDNISVAALRG